MGPAEKKRRDWRSSRISGLLISCCAGVAIYLVIRSLGQPQMGLVLGLMFWLLVYQYWQQQVGKGLIRRIEQLRRAGQNAEATALAWQAASDFQNFRPVQRYLRSHPELLLLPQVLNFSYDQAADAPGTTAAPSQAGPPPVETEPTPQLARAAIWILVLLPLVLLPLGRSIPPYLGIWPALIIGLLGFKLLSNSPSPWDRRIALTAITLAVLALVIFGLTLPASRIPGPNPVYSDLKPGTSSWPVKTVMFIILFISVMAHECAHGLAAYFSGDPTAKQAGRISLNPLRHIDPFGTVLLPAMLSLIPGGIIFGWAKPVPVNFYNLRHQRRGRLAVSLAGVGTNLLLALGCTSILMLLGVWLHLSYPEMASFGFANPWQEVVLSGLPQPLFWKLLIELLKAGIWINMILFSLNILPVPPLDGFRVVEAFLPAGVQHRLLKFQGAGMILLLALFFLKIVDYLLMPGIWSTIILTIMAGGVAKLG